MPMALAVGANGVQSAPDSTSMMIFELTLTALRKSETHKFENEPDQPPPVAAAPSPVADDDTEEVAKSPRHQRDALDSSVEMQPSTTFGVRQLPSAPTFLSEVLHCPAPSKRKSKQVLVSMGVSHTLPLCQCAASCSSHTMYWQRYRLDRHIETRDSRLIYTLPMSSWLGCQSHKRLTRMTRITRMTRTRETYQTDWNASGFRDTSSQVTEVRSSRAQRTEQEAGPKEH